MSNISRNPEEDSMQDIQKDVESEDNAEVDDLSGGDLADDDLPLASQRNLVGSDELQEHIKNLKNASIGKESDYIKTLVALKWLNESYLPESNGVISRQSVYNHYRNFCAYHDIEYFVSAAFGKLLRSVFEHVSTRRLGTRGRSKFVFTTEHPYWKIMFRYHYIGIALREPSISEEENNNSRRHSIPKIFPSNCQSPPKAFLTNLHTHYESLLKCFENCNFALAYELMSKFWQSFVSEVQAWFRLSHSVDYILQCDATFYDIVICHLFPNVITLMSAEKLLLIRKFAKNLESYIKHAMLNGYFDESFISRRMEGGFIQKGLLTVVARVFGQQVKRLTSINHTAQSLKQVIGDHDKVDQMLKDWYKLDITSILDQASWVCRCNSETIIHIGNFCSNRYFIEVQQEITDLLQKGSSIDEYRAWIDALAIRHIGNNPAILLQEGSMLILKWNFYTSLIIRDLTLKSASSFGCFQLLKLFLDEYLFYIVENKIAASR